MMTEAGEVNKSRRNIDHTCKVSVLVPRVGWGGGVLLYISSMGMF